MCAVNNRTAFPGNAHTRELHSKQPPAAGCSAQLQTCSRPGWFHWQVSEEMETEQSSAPVLAQVLLSQVLRGRLPLLSD
jgi:hypothetical protein